MIVVDFAFNIDYDTTAGDTERWLHRPRLSAPDEISMRRKQIGNMIPPSIVATPARIGMMMTIRLRQRLLDIKHADFSRRVTSRWAILNRMAGEACARHQNI